MWALSRDHACLCVCSVVSDSLWPLWTVACQVPLSVEFSRQEYWSGLSFPFPGDLPDPGIEPVPPALQADSLRLSRLGSPMQTRANGKSPWAPTSGNHLDFAPEKFPNSASPDTLLEKPLLVNYGALIWTASGSVGHQNFWNLKCP